MGRQPYARRRALVIISTIVLAVVLLLASAVYAGGGASATTEYRVRGGDTLWDIAAAEGPADADVRSTVKVIKRLNGLDSSLIQPGQTLRIPLPHDTASDG